MRRTILILIALFVDTSGTKVTSFVCSRLDRQKCRDSLHSFPGAQYVPDIYEFIHFGRLADPAEVGRDAQDMERARSWFVGHQASFPS